MGSNSIRTNLTKDDIISEITLSLGFDVKHENVFLIVEGSDDVKFWRRFLFEKVTIFESFSGKVGINEIIDEHFKLTPQVIGIRDRDYEDSKSSDNIFYYDFCCLEMMLIDSTETFQNIYNEYYSGNLSPQDLKTTILEQLHYLSLIRKNNEQNSWGIKINGISINNAFNKQTGEINVTTIVSRLNEMNNNFFAVEQDKHSQIEEEYAINLDTQGLMLITQGHDFIHLFAAFCHKPRRRSISSESILASLRCAYRKDDFITTYLYSELNSYETLHNMRIVS